MASLKEAAAVTEQLEELAGQLHAEVVEGRLDFGEATRLADQIGELADAIAAAFIAIDEAFTRGLGEPRAEAAAREKTRTRGARGTRSREQKAKAGGSTENEPTKPEHDDASSAPAELSREDLLERARELEIAGRSTMSKEELGAAIETAQQVSKEELLERAKEVGISGRSSMSKEELAEAVRAEESLSREELLERAREADIPGRSEMSKEELRQALSSQ